MAQDATTTGRVFQVGDLPKIKITFTDEDGVAVDPTTVELMVQTPSGARTTYTYGAGTVSRAGVGVYYKNYTVSESGTHYYHWEAGGAYTAVDEGSFKVAKSAF